MYKNGPESPDEISGALRKTRFGRDSDLSLLNFQQQ